MTAEPVLVEVDEPILLGPDHPIRKVMRAVGVPVARVERGGIPWISVPSWARAIWCSCGSDVEEPALRLAASSAEHRAALLSLAASCDFPDDEPIRAYLRSLAPDP